MDHRFYFADFREFDIFTFQDSNGTFLIVCSVCLTAVLSRLEVWESVFLLL